MQPLGMRVYFAAFSMFVSSLLGRSHLSRDQSRHKTSSGGIFNHVSGSFSRLTPQFVPT